MGSTCTLDAEYHAHFQRHAATIRARLHEFDAVPPHEYIHELCFCLLTPQSRAAHAEMVMAALRGAGFPGPGPDGIVIDPTPFLRNPSHYIRFHNQKARRLISVAGQQEEIMTVLTDPGRDERARREWLVENVNGMGWKEASHFLRNIGARDLAIIDRHILKHMMRCGAIDAVPRTITRRVYLDLEERFTTLAASAGLELQELDLLFWSMEEGSVRK